MTSSAEKVPRLLPRERLGAWLARLDGHRIYVPRCENDVWSYGLWDGEAQVALDYPMTVVPAKAMVLRQTEPLFAFRQTDNGGYRLEELRPEDQPVVVFGVRPCEGRAMALLDAVMVRPPAESHYLSRRRTTALVGLACLAPPSPNCFCLSVGGSPHSEDGLDILLTDLGAGFYVKPLTELGQALVAAGESEMEEVGPADEARVAERQAAAVSAIPRQLADLEDIDRRLGEAFEAQLWADESMRCVGCGICTYLCPTCHCFDINDEVLGTAPLTGIRMRTWDTCQFADFTMHSSGHNPRPHKAARLRQRINHKFRYGVEAGMGILCTGCGRCITQCPMEIDLIHILQEVRDRFG